MLLEWGLWAFRTRESSRVADVVKQLVYFLSVMRASTVRIIPITFTVMMR